ncbi:MAG: endonuclease [Candidatus Sericytochromatia bacterium]|nr:endonuclease [Candidatus Sericytochromatia bacterium]
MKKILGSLALFSIIAITGCNTASNIQNSPDQLQSYSSSNKSGFRVDADWYSSLSPDLQAYYAEAKGKTGSDLFDSLHTIISRNNKITGYQDSKSFMYATLDNITISNKTGLLDAYSEAFIAGSGGNGDTYKEVGDDNKDGVSGDFINCEHTWPQSFFNKQLPMVGDLNHLQSTLSVPNNRRSNFAFGTATGNIVYTTSGGSKLSVNDKPGATKTPIAKLKSLLGPVTLQSPPILNTNFDTVFEPGDQQKGRTARCMLYFYMRYFDQSIFQTGVQKDAFWTSKVPLFVEWSEQKDVVNDVDRKRNDLVFKKQGNRNPFIDIPNLGSLIGINVIQSK